MNAKTETALIYGIGIVFLLAYFAIQVVLLTTTIPPENKELLVGGQDTLKAGLILVLGYFFGSSRGSARKTAMLTPQNASGQ